MQFRSLKLSGNITFGYLTFILSVSLKKKKLWNLNEEVCHSCKQNCRYELFSDFAISKYEEKPEDNT